VFAYPTTVFLRGHNPKLSFFESAIIYDNHIHEIGKVIGQLIKGNVNFVIGTMSDKIEFSSDVHEDLRKLLREYPPKNIYYSIKGLVLNNLNRWQKKGRDVDKVMRYLKFGVTLLETGKYVFERCEGYSIDDIHDYLERIDEAYRSTKLTPIPEDKLRDILERVRRNILTIEGGVYE